MAYEDAIRGETLYLLRFLEECGLTEEDRERVVDQHLTAIYTLTVKMMAAELEGAIQRMLAK